MAFAYDRRIPSESSAATSPAAEPFTFRTPFDPSGYNGSVGAEPQLVNVFMGWGSISGIVLAILYVASLCYIVYDYVKTKKEDATLIELRHNVKQGAPLAKTKGSAAQPQGNSTLEQRLLAARDRASAYSGFLTPSLPDGMPAAANDGSFTRAELVKAHGVKHIAVIMDGNRRFGKKAAAEMRMNSSNGKEEEASASPPASTIEPSTANSFITRSKVYRSAIGVLKSVGMGEKLIGHKAGGEKLLDFARYCIDLNIPILTVYAFSTENWGRPQEEIDILMALFAYFFEQMREDAHKHGIYCRFIVGDPSRLNPEIVELMKGVERETRRIPNRRITVNVCVSYGSRLEIAQACQTLVSEGTEITEQSISTRLMKCLTEDDDENLEGVDVINGNIPSPYTKEEEAKSLAFLRSSDPDILFRTSGESRLSNFMLYQCAYSEMIFSTKAWPAIDMDDVEGVLVEYCCRHRRFGK